MAIINAAQFQERIQFFNGERLFASDLQALESFNREMRWLHNRSLHQAGVGSGYAVSGNIGDREVTIAPGYALDSLGREIILTETQVEAIPPVADNGAGASAFYDLTVSYPDDIGLKPSETRAGICMPAGVVRLREEPVFCWVRLSDDSTNRQPVDPNLKALVNNGHFVVLAQVEIFSCQLKQPVSTAQRRNARPPKQPRIACGVETNPTWRSTDVLAGSVGQTQGVVFLPFKFTAAIDTSSGGFQATPSYTAQLVGPRVFHSTGSVYISDALIDIPNDPPPSPKGFTIEIFRGITIFGSFDQSSVTTPPWDVAWMGIEA